MLIVVRCLILHLENFSRFRNNNYFSKKKSHEEVVNDEVKMGFYFFIRYNLIAEFKTILSKKKRKVT